MNISLLSTSDFAAFDDYATITIRRGDILTPPRAYVIVGPSKRIDCYARKSIAERKVYWKSAVFMPAKIKKRAQRQTEDQQWSRLAVRAQTTWAEENPF